MMSTATQSTADAPVAVPKRRRRSIEERRRVVEETFAPGASVARIARAHGVNANQVFHWRRLYQRGRLGGAPGTPALLPVTITGTVPSVKLAEEPRAAATPTESAGTIQLQLPKGRLRIDGAADPATLRAVLECLLG
jgi:transposase